MKTTFICVQPAIEYYQWQLEVMLDTFAEYRPDADIHILMAWKRPEQRDDIAWKQLGEKFPFAKFFFYQDTRNPVVYISSVRPRVLAEHFTAFPELKDRAIFYHDCDIALTKPLDLSPFLGDAIWYGSEVKGYIGANYIKSKEHGIYDEMCFRIGIAPHIPQDNESNTIGAQYILKNIGADYWAKVESDSVNLYQYFVDHLVLHPESPTYHPIQKWTADMWAVLWNGWLFGNETKVAPSLDFTWATSGIHEIEKNAIFHNAGVVTEDKKNIFFKGDYIKKAPYEDIEGLIPGYRTNQAGYWYAQQILKTAKSTCFR